MASSSDRRRGYTPPVDEAEQIFQRRVADFAAAVRRTGAPRFSMFCNEREQELARAALSASGWTQYAWDGGYEGAQRAVLCVYDGAPRPAPVRCLRIDALEDAGALTHRDYLGALMGLRIARECIGDILCGEAGAQLVVLQTVARLVMDELREVGRVHVRVSETDEIVPPAENERKSCTVTLASLRLDALLAAMLHTGRAQAARLIGAGAVMVNHVPKTSPSEAVYEGDVFSVRGHGKYELIQVGAKSRKDRIFVTFTEF